MKERIPYIIGLIVTLPILIYYLKKDITQFNSTEPNTPERGNAVIALARTVGIAVGWIAMAVFLFAKGVNF